MISRVSLVLIMSISLSHAFQFDIWKSGMNIQDAVEAARENHYPLTKANDMLVRKRFDWRNLKDYKNYREFKYHTSLFGKEARVSIHFTQATGKLYKVRISWYKFYGDKDEFENMLYQLLDKKYGKRKIGAPSNLGDYVLNKYRIWEPDRQTKIIVKRSPGNIELVYLDKRIEQGQEISKQRKKLKIIMTDAPKL